MMSIFGVVGKLISLYKVKRMLCVSRGKKRVSGLRQGCVMCPWSFNKELTWMVWSGKCIPELEETVNLVGVDG